MSKTEKSENLKYKTSLTLMMFQEKTQNIAIQTGHKFYTIYAEY